jgi:hypothetical protein
LPGSRTGLDKILDANRFVGSFASQLMAVLLILVIGRLAVALWHDARLSFARRLTVAPNAMLVVLVLAAACCDALMSPYTPELSLIVGLSGTLVAVNAIGPSLTPAPMRASGLILVLETGASVAQMGARLLALQASGAALPKQFVTARWLASVASGLDVLALVLVFVWVLSLWPRGRFPLASVVASAAALSLLSHRGARPGAGFSAVLLSRGLAQLHRDPASLWPLALQNSQEILAVLLSLLLLLRPREVRLEIRASVAMVLLARSSPDIPLCAGLLVLGALNLLRQSLDVSPRATPSSLEPTVGREFGSL